MGIAEKIDDFISIFSPMTALKRKSARTAYNKVPTWRNSADWMPIDGKGEQLNAPSRDLARRKARDLERNSLVVNAVINAMTRNVVGKGFNLQVRSSNKAWNNQVEALWKDWCRPGNCEITGKFSLKDVLKLIERRKLVDGGMIVLKTYEKDAKVPYKLQLIEVDDLNSGGLIQADNGNMIVNGIEVNKFGKPIAYYMKQACYDNFNQSEPQRFDAKDVFFLVNHTRPTELREMSPMANSLSDIHDLDEFMEAVAFKEKTAAAIVAWITTPKDVGMSIGRSMVNDVNTPPPPQEERIKPGSAKRLNPGEDVKPMIPNGQVSELNSYNTITQRNVAAGKGLSYEMVSRDVSQVTYSSARQNLIEDWKTIEEEQTYLIEHFLDFIFEDVVNSAILKGTLQPPRDFYSNTDYMKHEFIGVAMPWIDPQKEATANQIMLATGQITLKELYARRGKDWEEELEQLSQEQEMLQKAGLAQQKGDDGNGENNGSENNDD